MNGTDENYKFEKAKEGDPQCESSYAFGQCPFKPVPGSKFCPRHGGNQALLDARKKESKLYMSAKWQERIGVQADHPKVKSLNEEIGIIRIMIDERLNLCQDSQDLLMNSTSISGMIEKLEKLVKTAASLDEKRGRMLDVSQAQALAVDIVQVLSVYVRDPVIMQAVVEDVTEIFSKLNN